MVTDFSARRLAGLGLFAGLRWIYAALSLLPVRQGTVVFTSYPDASDNALAMYRYLSQQMPRLRTIWLVGPQQTQSLPALRQARLLSREGFRAMHALATAQYVFHTHGIFRFARRRRCQTIVNLWHGMPMKTIGTYDKTGPRLPLGDVTIASSEMFRPIMARAFAMDEADVLVVGQPRNDPMVRAARAAAPTSVLWMPTYRRSGQGEIRHDSPFSSVAMEAVLRRLDDGLAGTATRLILKLHPMDALNLELPHDFANVEVIRRGDVHEDLPLLMARSRRLITDYSSAAIDFAVLGRPIGYFCPDRDDYDRGFIPEVAVPFFAAGEELADVEALIAFVLDKAQPEQGETPLVQDRDDRSAERLWAALEQRQ